MAQESIIGVKDPVRTLRMKRTGADQCDLMNLRKMFAQIEGSWNPAKSGADDNDVCHIYRL